MRNDKIQVGSEKGSRQATEELCELTLKMQNDDISEEEMQQLEYRLCSNPDDLRDYVELLSIVALHRKG